MGGTQQEGGRYHSVVHGRATFKLELDTGWAETLSIMSDEPFMRQIRTGLDQADRGQLHSFEDIFGEEL
jgi:hypothetical protein